MLEVISSLICEISINLPENDSIAKIFTFVILYIPDSYLQYDHVVFLEPFYLWVEAGGKGKGLSPHHSPAKEGEQAAGTADIPLQGLCSSVHGSISHASR